uniref:PDZ domain-containing protein n=1 Tax=Macrostomum lignano TaxID=282301 RepID=A0A1I8H476_9PLAT
LNSAELCIQIQTLGLSSRLSRTARNAVVPVTEVAPGGPSARAGLRRGDRISAINGTPLSRFSEEALRNLLENRRVNRIALTVLSLASPTVAKAEDASAVEDRAELFPSDEEEAFATMDSPLSQSCDGADGPRVTRREKRRCTPERGLSSPSSLTSAAAAGPTSPRVHLRRGYPRSPQQLEQLAPPWSPRSVQSSPAKSQLASPSASSVFGRLSGEDSSLSMSPSPQTPLVGMRQRAATGSAIGSASPVPVFLFSTVPDSADPRPGSGSSQCESPGSGPSPTHRRLHQQPRIAGNCGSPAVDV